MTPQPTPAKQPGMGGKMRKASAPPAAIAAAVQQNGAPQTASASPKPHSSQPPQPPALPHVPEDRLIDIQDLSLTSPQSKDSQKGIETIEQIPDALKQKILGEINKASFARFFQYNPEVVESFLSDEEITNLNQANKQARLYSRNLSKISCSQRRSVQKIRMIAYMVAAVVGGILLAFQRQIINDDPFREDVFNAGQGLALVATAGLACYEFTQAPKVQARQNKLKQIRAEISTHSNALQERFDGAAFDLLTTWAKVTALQEQNNDPARDEYRSRMLLIADMVNTQWEKSRPHIQALLLRYLERAEVVDDMLLQMTEVVDFIQTDCRFRLEKKRDDLQRRLQEHRCFANFERLQEQVTGKSLPSEGSSQNGITISRAENKSSDRSSNGVDEKKSSPAGRVPKVGKASTEREVQLKNRRALQRAVRGPKKKAVAGIARGKGAPPEKKPPLTKRPGIVAATGR